ncbi:ATP-binding protein [Aeromonas phage phiA047]|nr:ATP-binding protein [Aeromonas phage phiA047]
MILESILTYHLIVGAMLHGPPFQWRENIVANNNEYRCAVRNLYHEGRGEGLVGQAYIVKSVLNRVRDTKHPHSICKVIYQRMQFSWTHQIPKNKQQVPNKTTSEKELLKQLEALSTAVILLDRVGIDFTQGSQFYHSVKVKPNWDYSKLEKTNVVGNHVFYKRKGE